MFHSVPYTSRLQRSRFHVCHSTYVLTTLLGRPDYSLLQRYGTLMTGCERSFGGLFGPALTAALTTAGSVLGHFPLLQIKRPELETVPAVYGPPPAPSDDVTAWKRCHHQGGGEGGDRPSVEERQRRGGDRPSVEERQRRGGDRPSVEERQRRGETGPVWKRGRGEGGDRPSVEERQRRGGDRPSVEERQRRGGDRPSVGERQRRGGDRPSVGERQRRGGDRPSVGERQRRGGDRPSVGERQRRGGDRPSVGERQRRGGDRPSFPSPREDPACVSCTRHGALDCTALTDALEKNQDGLFSRSPVTEDTTPEGTKDPDETEQNISTKRRAQGEHRGSTGPEAEVDGLLNSRRVIQSLPEAEGDRAGAEGRGTGGQGCESGCRGVPGQKDGVTWCSEPRAQDQAPGWAPGLGLGLRHRLAKWCRCVRL
uniref:Uncharacterized protein n=1 Tax=Knipowitschia caucasica TaxID=637954 RepID=A0AAV2K4T2_KNICA